MPILQPASPEELASALAEAASAGRTIQLGGAGTKRLMAGPLEPAGISISTAAMRRVLQYEPKDLTISVEAGLSFSELARLLAGNRQMVPLDPPFFADATVGGVVAANTSGPRRRLYGTARDLIIGMKFATLEGKLIQSGGMVVKNVAGLDMGKLMIGSFGTLAAIAVVNFKLQPIPEATRSFVQSFATAVEAMRARDAVLQGVLQPAAIDVLNPQAAQRVGLEGWSLLTQAGGNQKMIERYARELRGAQVVEEDIIWTRIREFTPDFLRDHPAGAVVRTSTTLDSVRQVVENFPGTALARAGSGVCFGYFADAGQAQPGIKSVIEFAPEERKRSLDLWPSRGSDFEMMKKIKQMFDPRNLLNRGRLYGRL